jgi:uncharacterized membrane protein HdeD (DUF308 family)
MSPSTLGSEEGRDWGPAWWILSLLGLLSIAAGVIVLFKPGDSLATLAVISGVFLLLDGIMEIVASLSRATASRGLVALLGVLTLIVGVLLIRHPIQGVTAIALLLGLWLITIGVVRLVATFEVREHRGWNLFVAAIDILAGIVIVSSPDIGFTTLALLVGIAFVMNGVGLFALGWKIHDLQHEAGASSHHAGAAPA